MGAKSARKGAAGEREVMAILREHGYNVERGGSLSFGEAPAVFFRRSRSPWCVVMKLEDWLNLYQAAETGENRK